MKPPSAPERALKTITQFQKEIAGVLTVSGEAFTGFLPEAIRFFAGDDDFVILSRPKSDTVDFVYRSQNGPKPVCVGDDPACWKKTLDEAKFRVVGKNDGSCIHKDYRAWMLVPILVKKELFAAIVIVRRRGGFTEREADTARQLGSYFTALLRDIRIRNKKASVIADETRHRFLLRTQTNLARKQPDFPGFSQAVDYSACTGSDMGQTYRSGEDTFLSCVCDLTASDTERQTGLVYLDTWFSILSQTSLDVPGMLTRLNTDMVKRVAECYASVAVLKYAKSAARVEIAGTGSAAAFYFNHDEMTVRTFSFGPAAGIRKDLPVTGIQLPVKAGDILCLCSDGLTDTRKSNGELHGTDTLAELVRRNYFLSADDLAKQVLKAVSETGAAGVNTDDRTLQILKIE